MEKIIIQIRKELKQKGKAELREVEQRFFKEKIKSHGVRSAEVVKIGRKYFQEIKNTGKENIFSLVEQLFQTGYNDEARIACDWSYNVKKEYSSRDFSAFEKWIKKYIDNWAKCDTFCNHTVGDFLEKYPAYIKNLKKWTASKNRWLRRASAVSLIVPARKGKFLPDIFEIAGKLMLDEDDMIQKGYGWMLKVASEANEKKVFDYVMKNKAKMLRTALRYAIEKMPKKLKQKAMAK